MQDRMPRNLGELAKSIKRSVETSNDDAGLVLGELCRRFPQNDRFGLVLVKVIAVDRLYRAALYRRKVVYEDVARGISSSDLDEQLARLGNRLARNNITKVSAAAALVAGFGNENDPKYWVFASKYLHFHRRKLFPILDQFAEKRLRGLDKAFHLSDADSPNQRRYERFCRQIFALQLRLSRETGYRPSLSDLDTYLWKP